MALAAGPALARQQPAFPEATPESQGIPADALRELAAVARGYVANDLAAGAELLVVKNRRTVLHEAFGMADRERGVAMVPGTIFNLRSMTKMFTGAAIQLLIDSGDLDLDMKAADFLEGFRNEKSESITIGELLAHRGGLPLSILIKAGRLDAYPNLIAMADAVGKGGPEFPPDSKYWYSDSGSDTLAAIVETVSGKGVAEFVSERLFKPLGMNDTFYLTKTTPHDQSRVASLYLGAAGAWTRQWNGRDPPFYPYPWGSQTAFGTLEDYAKFLAMLLDQGRARYASATKDSSKPEAASGAVGPEILTKEAVERILTPRSLMAQLGSDNPFPTGFRDLTPWYGQLSVLHLPSATPAAKPVVIGHSGSDGTDAWAFPDRDLIILYFTQSRGGLTPIRFEAKIDRLLLHPGAPPAVDPALAARFAPYLSRYHEGFREVAVVVQGGHLAIDLPDSLVFELVEPADGTEWKAPGGGFSVIFERAAGGDAASGAAANLGEVTGLDLHTGKTHHFVRGAAPPEPAVDAAKLAALAGDYCADGTTQVQKVVVEGSRLALELTTQPGELTLRAPDDEGWWALIADPRHAVRFDVAADGSVTCTSRIASPEQVWHRVAAKPSDH
jgi:CubicO group peptidase (beta-lactamase class C family)